MVTGRYEVSKYSLKNQYIVRLGSICEAVRKKRIGSRQKLINKLIAEFGYHISMTTVVQIEGGNSIPTLDFLEKFFQVSYGDQWADNMIAALDIAYRGRK